MNESTPTPDAPIVLQADRSPMLEDRYFDALEEAKAKLGKPAPALEVYVSRQTPDNKWDLCGSLPAEDLDIGRVGEKWGGGTYRFTLRTSKVRGNLGMVQGDIAHPISPRQLAALPATTPAPAFTGNLVADELAAARQERNMFLEKLLTMMDRGGAAPAAAAPAPQPTPLQQIQSMAEALKALREVDPQNEGKGGIAGEIIQGVMGVAQMAMPTVERLVDRIGQRAPHVVYAVQTPQGVQLLPHPPVMPMQAAPQPATNQNSATPPQPLKLAQRADDEAPVDLASLPEEDRFARVWPQIVSMLQVFTRANEPDPSAYAEMIFDLLDLSDLLEKVMSYPAGALVTGLIAEVPAFTPKRELLDKVETELRTLYGGDNAAKD